MNIYSEVKKAKKEHKPLREIPDYRYLTFNEMIGVLNAKLIQEGNSYDNKYKSNSN